MVNRTLYAFTVFDGRSFILKRKESWYAVIGGVVGAILTMVVFSFLPMGAQSQSDANFGKVTCSELEVVRPGGTRGAWIFVNDDGGRVMVFGKNGTLKDDMNLLYGDGGFVGVVGNNGTPQATMAVWEGEESGGRIHVYGPDKLPGREFGFPKATIAGSEDGGTINLRSASGGSIRMRTDSDTAHILVNGKSHLHGLYRAAEMGVNEDGGVVLVRGIKGKSGVHIGVDENGGVFAVYDKNADPAVFARVDGKGGIVSVAGKESELKAITSKGLR